MMKFNKDYKLKIIFITISIAFLFTNVLYSSQFSREDLRLEIGAGDDTYLRINEVNALTSKNYNKFRDWLGDISQDKLENTIIFLDALEPPPKGLTGSDSNVRRANADALKALIDTGLVSKEVFSSEEIESMFREVYGRGIPAPGYVHYYLKFLNILKDNPPAAYQVFNWDIEELSELFRIFDYFAKGAALDPSYYKEEAGEKYFLEKELIKGGLIFLRTPNIFISHLKEKIKTTISDNSVKLAIKVYEAASVNAARGLIKALGLDKGSVIILYDSEIDFEQAERFFPGYNIRAYSGFTDKGVIRVQFRDNNMRIESSRNFLSVSLPYTPFKFNLPERVSEEELNKMRESLGITSRKVIVIGSPSDAEFNEFIQSYNALYGKLDYAERPLLIIGFRQRRNGNEFKLLGSLSGQSIVVRNDDKAPLPDVKSNNALILNTSGELLRMYALADVAIVGNNRNIFEPASQKTAVLYFDGSWHYNEDAKGALVKTGAAQIFSKEHLEELINSIDKAKKMAVDGFEVVETYRKEVLLGAEEFALQVIGARQQLRDKFITASSPVNRIEQLVNNMRNGTLLSLQEMQSLGFHSNEELFLWINSVVNENKELMRVSQYFNRNKGGQYSLIINPENHDYALKVEEQNYADMLIEKTIEAFKLSQKRLGGLVTPFFLLSDFDSKHEAIVRLVSSLRDEDISEKGEAFVDEYLSLIEAYWQRGVFDHGFKLDELGTIGEEKRLIVLNFGLSEDTLNEGLFIVPADEKERFWNTFNIAVYKLHNTRDVLKKISPAIAKYFEDQLEKRYEIKLLPIWNRSMRGGDNATELAGKLRDVVRRFRPQLATSNYVFPLIGGEFDRFIISKIEDRYKQRNASLIPESISNFDTEASRSCL